MTEKENAIFPEYGHLTREEQLTKLIDQLLCLWDGRVGFRNLDYYVTDLAFKAIADAVKNNPEYYPVTAAMADFLIKKGLIASPSA